jgi:hypothetical protein
VNFGSIDQEPGRAPDSRISPRVIFCSRYIGSMIARPLTSRVTHAGIVEVDKFRFNLP